MKTLILAAVAAFAIPGAALAQNLHYNPSGTGDLFITYDDAAASAQASVAAPKTSGTVETKTFYNPSGTGDVFQSVAIDPERAKIQAQAAAESAKLPVMGTHDSRPTRVVYNPSGTGDLFETVPADQ